MLNDLRYAFRTLRRNPAFTGVAVLTLALGIGANTALFSVADAVLFKPLAYPEPERIVKIDGGPLKMTKTGFTADPEMERSPLFEATGVFVTGGLNVGGEPTAERVLAAGVSAGFFPAMGTKPVLGRPFTVDEERANARVAIVSEALWRRRLGASPALDAALVLNGHPYTVIGIMPAGYSYPNDAEVWIPLGVDQQLAGGAIAPDSVARLSASVTLSQALEGVERLQYGPGPRDPRARPVIITSLREELVGSVRPLFGIMAAAVGLVLLVSCLNVANLLLARVSARDREMSVRRALGASRGRLIQYLLCESVLLAFMAAVLAIPAALWTLDAMRLILPAGLHGSSRMAIDARAASVTAVLSAAAVLLFGLAPALSVRPRGASELLRSGTATASPFWRRFRGGLVAAQLAAALILLAGSMTIVETVSSLLRTDLGARGENALTLQLTLPYGRYGTSPTIVDFYDRLETELRAIPGVEAVGVSAMIPGSTEVGLAFRIQVDGLERATAEPETALYLPASPEYFRALGVDLLAGRAFGPADRGGAPKVAIVSESLARVYGLEPQQLLGRNHVLGWRKEQYRAEIVGVVRDVRLRGPESEGGAQLYVPFAQSPPYTTLYVVMKTTGSPRASIQAARGAVSATDDDLPPYNIRTFDEIRASYVADRRFAMMVMLAFAGLTAVLAAVGLYGVMSYLVQLRTREIGIRVALGATPGEVLRETLRSGLVYGAIGVAAGCALAGAASRVFISRIAGLQEVDPFTLTFSAAAMMLIALGTSWLPARRAGRIDPVVALRAE
jgi:putative ABC transport system permease protein